MYDPILITIYIQALPSKLRLRLKISYSKGDIGAITDQVDWSEPA